MADGDFGDSTKPSAKADAAAMDAALSAPANSEEARDYLRKQSLLADLQIDNLRKQDEYELSHLRWRRFNDQMKGALQIMLVALGLLIVVGIGAAMWNASQADGIVVEAFSVPPSFATRGIGGDVVADDMTNKIAAIRDIANGNSFVRSKDVHGDRAEDIKVQIPETGVSLAEAWRYLKGWLGHERPLRGNVRDLGGGRIALTVALAGDTSQVFSGVSSELDRLEQRAAERVFEGVDPSNYVLYLDAKNREAEAYSAIAHFAQTAPDNVSKSGFMSLWSAMTRSVTGDVRLANARARYSLVLNPKMVIAHREIMVGEHLLGHDEEALKQAGVVALAREQDVPAAMRGYAFVQFLGAAQFERDADTGDFQHARIDPCFYCSAANTLLFQAEDSARAHNLPQSRSDAAAALATGSVSPAVLSRTRAFMDIAGGDWPAAVADAKAYGDALMTDYGRTRFGLQHYRTLAVPLRAYALAKNGEFPAAQKIIDATARDCYHCVRMRGIVAALNGNGPGAAAWFAEAVKQGPSLPFAYNDWGEMLLRQGDLDGAIAKFAVANSKGPHFADPLEMWGEALIAKNRSDLALAKFEEAAKYAPNWGRLHLKWGEALWWSGDHAGAQKQFATAAHLDLTPSEKSKLARLRGYG